MINLKTRRTVQAAMMVALTFHPVVASALCDVAARTLISTGGGFNPPVRTTVPSGCPTNGTCAIGDVNGDGRDDLVTFYRGSTGHVDVALSTGADTFQSRVGWHNSFCYWDEICKVADVNGDGKDDIVAFTRRQWYAPYADTGDVWVALSNGNSFVGTGWKWNDWFCIGNEVCEVGDVNGDGKADVVAFTRGVAKDVWVGLSAGGSFAAGRKWHDSFCWDNEVCKVGDVNGDRRADIVAFTRGDRADVYVATSAGSFFSGTGWKWQDWFCAWDETCDVADLNADGKADLIAFNPNYRTVWVGPAAGVYFATGQRWADSFSASTLLTGDINGDRRHDVVGVRSADCEDTITVGVE